ncbi:DUF1289 domain-containing protein [Gammaproteobacteria bacterium]|nr:DUF1289 domain-containing protein [Gammaproteobacteria bacterium]
MGICSTTYGDLVCRGCRRFAHEIVDWNGYSEVQKASILERLKQIKHEVLSQYLIIEDKDKFEGFCRELGFGFVDLEERMYAVLAYLITKSERLKIGGLTVSDSLEDFSGASDLMRFLESEMYTRAQAHYERNFKILI